MAATDKKLKVYEGQVPFNLIEASKLKKDDDFIQKVEPFGKVKIFREKLIGILDSANNIHDFYVQGVDPSLNEDGTGIQYVTGKMPAVGHSFNWGRKVAFEYAHYNGSRLGTDVEYYLFCGVLIKELIEAGYSVNEAWNMVCVNSADIGNYNGKGKVRIMPTGSVKILRFADLANTCKWLTARNKIYSASGAYCHRSDCGFVADVSIMYGSEIDDRVTVPWVVIPV